MKPHILLVDDFEPVQKISCAMVKELGYDCSCAGSGTEALEILKNNHFSLVLMDIQMPAIDGLETTRLLRKHEIQAHKTPTPVIGITGNASDDDKVFCIKAGMNGVISKPFRLQELAETLEKYLPKSI